MATYDKLAKEAAEIWARTTQDDITKAVDAMESLVAALTTYADDPGLAEQVRDTLISIQVIMPTLQQLTQQVEGIAMLRALQVAADAFRDHAGLTPARRADDESEGG